MQLVVPSAVTKAVRAATITFTTTSINRFFFITLNYQFSARLCRLARQEFSISECVNLRLPDRRRCSNRHHPPWFRYPWFRSRRYP